MNILKSFVHLSTWIATIVLTGSISDASISTTVTNNPYKGEVTITVDLEIKNTRPMTDILFVIDNSGSMALHQTKLFDIADQFATKLASSNMDYHVGVITTDSGALYGQTRIITGSDPASLFALKNNLMPGTEGSGTEEPFKSLMLAFSTPLLTTQNANFLRDDANLEVIFVTDAEDQSFISSADLLKHLSGLSTNGKKVVAHGILADGQSCQGEGTEPIKLRELINLTSGTIHDVCSATFATPLDTIGNSILSSTTIVPITPTPSVTRIPLFMEFQYETLLVTFGQRTLLKGDFQKGYVWDSMTNEIILGSKVDWSGEANGTPLLIKFKPTHWGF